MDFKEFQDEIDWCRISRYQDLSESIMKEFQTMVDWYRISEFQHLSNEFILNNCDNIKIRWLQSNKKIPPPKSLITQLELLKILND